MDKALIPRIFLIAVLLGILYLCYLIFSPFLIDIIVAAVFATIFYPLYQRLSKLMWNKRGIASLVLCIGILLVVIIPLFYFALYTAERTVEAIPGFTAFFDIEKLNGFLDNALLDKLESETINKEVIRNYIFENVGTISQWLIGRTTILLGQATSFLISIPIILFTMFFFFLDGEAMLKKIMVWTPFPNKYDQQLFKKFRDVSFSTIISTFMTAIAQGIIGALGYSIIGMSAFFPGILIGFASLLPYIGAGIIWVPTAVYLLLTHQIWQGVFLFIWGAAVISTVDNLIRAYIIKGKAQVHPIFVIFSLLGGISLFGFWGLIFGPLVISLAVTLFHIYEDEYGSMLEKEKCP